MAITGGFGTTMDLERGTSRQWVVGRDGVKRWADTNEPVDAAPTKRNKHGCCADKACNDTTCMELPTGKTCGDCVHERRCCLMFGHTPTDTYCDWFPRRFREVTPNVEVTGAEPALSAERPR